VKECSYFIQRINETSNRSNKPLRKFVYLFTVFSFFPVKITEKLPPKKKIVRREISCLKESISDLIIKLSFQEEKHDKAERKKQSSDFCVRIKSMNIISIFTCLPDNDIFSGIILH
jgi:hypothetical protein